MIRQASSYLDVENYTGDIAILGGSFNPIHVGHIRMAESFYKQFGIDIVLMPNKTTYYKENRAFVSDEDRLNMLSLVAEHYPYMYFSDLEIIRGGVTHTIDTIRELKKVNISRDIYFIIGGDSLEWIDKWVDAEELISTVHFVSAIRGDTDLDRTKAIIDRLVMRESNASECFHGSGQSWTELPLPGGDPDPAHGGALHAVSLRRVQAHGGPL